MLDVGEEGELSYLSVLVLNLEVTEGVGEITSKRGLTSKCDEQVLIYLLEGRLLK